MLDNVKVEKFITAAMKYKGDKYSQPKRLQKGFSDCSSLIWKALKDTGFLDESQTTRTVSTKYMRDGDPRFRKLEIEVKDAQRGDILWYQRPGTDDDDYFGHVAIVLNETQVLEAITPKVAITSRTRIKYQRVYRVKALEMIAKTLDKPVVTAKNFKGVVTTTSLNVRDHDTVAGKVLGQLKKGIEVKIVGETKTKWYEIVFKGERGFVSNQYIKIQPKEQIIENVDILINGKLVKRGYIIKGVTYMAVNGQDVPVRRLFENMGAKVEWTGKQVQITL